MINPVRFLGRAQPSILALATLLALSGCEEGAILGVSAGETPVVVGGTSVEKDVERPDIFGVSESALWDGRPSLGGVWVAYPGSIDPERVIIINVANGKTVIGALFRRERDNPGPKIQMSSDAASALGVIAGSPTEISIVVLRRETVVVAPPPSRDTSVESASDAVAGNSDQPAEDIGAIVEEVLGQTPAPATAVATGPPPAKPFIQIGTFSTEQNALDLVTILANEGVQAEVRTNTSGNRTLYRVVSGPVRSKAELDERLAIIKSLGFTDAFFFG